LFDILSPTIILKAGGMVEERMDEEKGA